MDRAYGNGRLAQVIHVGQMRANRRRVTTNVTKHKFNIALCLTVLLDMDAAAAAAWTYNKEKWYGQSPDAGSDEVQTLQRALEDAVLTASPSCCAAWVDPDVATLGTSALRKATKALRDKRMQAWVKQRNDLHGAAPTTCSVLHRGNGEAAEIANDGFVLQQLVESGHVSSGRVWCHRWRRRCGVKVGALRTKEPLDLATKQEKVLQRLPKKGQNGIEIF